ncbi:MAG: hypothetical protein V7L14_17120 [Nostoc sp.]|uniref:hypothetical protein n=1 Tax=unclassified Nostoc TaxID=2593658 RepID=UPI0025E8BBCF|nr:hypothetical protein [Nostoc sp. NOS(2021)]MBN3897406.1 hypothetical protein [Nostoc sp. NOS(2021)]
MPTNRLTKYSSKNDTFLQQFFACIPPQVVATFTDAQLTELQKVFRERVSKRHAVDIRLSTPFNKKRFYVVFLLGKEKRSKQNRKDTIFKPVNSILLIRYCLVLITFLLGALYIVEMVLGINTFPNQEIQEFVKYLMSSF